MAISYLIYLLLHRYTFFCLSASLLKEFKLHSVTYGRMIRAALTLELRRVAIRLFNVRCELSRLETQNGIAETLLPFKLVSPESIDRQLTVYGQACG